MTSKQRSLPDPRSVRMADEFPLLWELAKDYDDAVNKLGASATKLTEEADRAMNEIWNARQYVSEEAVRGR